MTSDDWLEIEREARAMHARHTADVPGQPGWDQLPYHDLENYRAAARIEMERQDAAAVPIPEPMHYPLALPTSSPRAFRAGCMCGWRGTTNMTKAQALARAAKLDHSKPRESDR